MSAIAARARLEGMMERTYLASDADARPAISIRPVSVEELEQQLESYCALLSESVHGGASLGFLPPLHRSDAATYWLSLRPEIRSGSRLLLGAYAHGGLVGTGQLHFPPWPNARHRAEVQKLFVSAGLAGRGVGGAVLAALHERARQRGRSLLLLNTRRGESPESFYQAVGYRRAGVIPGYTMGPTGQRLDNVTLYYELL